MATQPITPDNRYFLSRLRSYSSHFAWAAVSQSFEYLSTISNHTRFLNFDGKVKDLFYQTADSVSQKEGKSVVTVNGVGRTWLFFPRLRRAHSINNRELIRELLMKNRGGDLLDSGFTETLQPLIDSHTMLLCPYTQHRRLRKPLEKAFGRNATLNTDSLMKLLKGCYLGMMNSIDTSEAMSLDMRKFVKAYVFDNIFEHLGLQLSESQKTALADAFAIANPQNCFELRKLIADYFANQQFFSGSAMESLANDPNLSVTEKVSQAILLFAAGTHTTEKLILFLIGELESTRIMDLLYEEWKNFLDCHQISPSDEAFFPIMVNFVQSSDYLHACYLETLRLFPIIPVIKRIAKTSFYLGETEILAGDEIHLNLLAAQRNTLHWGEDADSFNPERFKGYLTQYKNPGFFTFNLGSQSCLGKYLAEAEVKAIVLVSTFLFADSSRYRKKSVDTLPKEDPKIKSSYRDYYTDGFTLTTTNYRANLQFVKKKSRKKEVSNFSR